MMEEIPTVEEKMLQEAIDNDTDVRIIFTNGFQTKAKIIDFDYEVIAADVNRARWYIYKHTVSTIVVD